MEKARHGHDAQAHSYSRDISGSKNSFAVGEKKANQNEGGDWRIVPCKIPYQKCSKAENSSTKDRPQQVHRSPGQQCEGSGKNEDRREIHIQ